MKHANNLLRQNTDIIHSTEQTFSESIKKLPVTPTAFGVRRSELLILHRLDNANM